MVFPQQTHNVMVESLVGHILRQPFHVVSDIPVCKVVQQDLASLKTAFPSSKEQWCLILQKYRNHIENLLYNTVLL